MTRALRLDYMHLLSQSVVHLDFSEAKRCKV
jgi:hypothetical protein